ncbi:MAG: hypothetical protein JWQ88_3118 [Rhodoferax sp.]|nr:hypothetical protein [Rhodoferax sp.]
MRPNRNTLVHRMTHPKGTTATAVTALAVLLVSAMAATALFTTSARSDADAATASAQAATLAVPGAASTSQTGDLPTRGAYLAHIGGCAGCHTVQHGKPFAGGRGVPTPFGTLYSSNITPDPAHGIGRYSLDDFRRVMREGTAPGGKHLYPAMPYTAYTKMSDADLKALFDHLQHGVTPAPDVPPPNEVGFPFNQRWGLKLWKMAFLTPGPYTDKPARGAEWNRGAYLTQAVGHCGACHTPRGVAFQERGEDETSRHFLTGEVNDHWFGSNLTGDPVAGLGRLATEDIAAFLKTGYAAGLSAYGSMADEVEQSLQHMSEDDVRAVAVYLKTLPPQREAGRYRPSSETVRTLADGNHTRDASPTGQVVYQHFCAQCHQADGSGVPRVYPRLAGNPSVLAEDPSALIRLVIEGGHTPRTANGPPPQSMPGFASTLTDVAQANVLTYIREAWGHDAKPVTTTDVSKMREALKE